MTKTKFLVFLLGFTFLSMNLGFSQDTDTYNLDTGHTYIGFDVERFMVGEVSGRFNDFSGEISLQGNDLTTLRIQTTINANSLDSNNDTRDGHLKGAIWLDTKKYPEITFKSTGVKKENESNYIISGELTIRGITNVVEIPTEILGPFKDPTNMLTLGLKGDIVINRFDYGISFNKLMDNGSLFIDNMVKIKIRALAIKRN